MKQHREQRGGVWDAGSLNVETALQAFCVLRIDPAGMDRSFHFIFVFGKARLNVVVEADETADRSAPSGGVDNLVLIRREQEGFICYVKKL